MCAIIYLTVQNNTARLSPRSHASSREQLASLIKKCRRRSRAAAASQRDALHPSLVQVTSDHVRNVNIPSPATGGRRTGLNSRKVALLKTLLLEVSGE